MLYEVLVSYLVPRRRDESSTVVFLVVKPFVPVFFWSCLFFSWAHWCRACDVRWIPYVLRKHTPSFLRTPTILFYDGGVCSDLGCAVGKKIASVYCCTSTASAISSCIPGII